ncbi:unnamed protein product [Urochloa decumbens]|uniref:Uncharacterized protein n=1 Tax=Urochloa decumbens TaxID=240449 RepID=A0ABC9GMP7_9POAL
MVYFLKHAVAMVIVLSFLFLGCDANDPPSSSMLKHNKMKAGHVRKLLNLTGAAATTTVTEKQKAAAPSECSQSAVVVSQAEAGLLPGGLPSYSVTITNTCLSCAVRDVHVSCGEFGSAELVDPGDFRRVAAGDCLVRGGGAMRPGETISFEYANMFQYDLDVASVACSCS